MNTYAHIAINVVNDALKANVNPIDSWNKYADLAFGAGSASASKSCPKGTFLGLCEEGYIKGIAHGDYTRSKKNKEYAIKAVELIGDNRILAERPDELWEQIINGTKKHNGQMYVVCELYKRGLIID